jgi:hypothetical protein
MRTVIYVREPSTVAIKSKGPEDCLLMYQFPKGNSIKPGSHHFERGIYVVLSKSDLDVSGPSASAVALPNNKDIPPDPQLQQIIVASGVPVAALEKFIALVKGIEVGDGAAPPDTVPPEDATPDSEDEPDEA